MNRRILGITVFLVGLNLFMEHDLRAPDCSQLFTGILDLASRPVVGLYNVCRRVFCSCQKYAWQRKEGFHSPECPKVYWAKSVNLINAYRPDRLNCSLYLGFINGSIRYCLSERFARDLSSIETQNNKYSSEEFYQDIFNQIY